MQDNGTICFPDLVNQRLANLSVARQTVNNTALRAMGLCQNHSVLWHCSVKADTAQHKQMDVWLCSNKTLGTLKFKPHIISICHKVFSFLILFSIIQQWEKIFLTHKMYQNRTGVVVRGWEVIQQVKCMPYNVWGHGFNFSTIWKYHRQHQRNLIKGRVVLWVSLPYLSP